MGWGEDSAGGTPTDAAGTTALPGKSLMIGVVKAQAGLMKGTKWGRNY